MSVLKEFLFELTRLVEPTANQEIPADKDDFVVFEWCGGNYDDAFDMGVNAGETYMARQVQALYRKFAENV